MPKKAPDAFRTISEVSEWLGVSPHVLRFWESKFTQVKPVKRAGGRRYYRPGDMELLGGIRKLLHDDGLTVKGVQKVLKEQGVRTVSSMSPPVEDDENAAPPANPIFRAPKPNVDLPVSETTGQKDAASLPLFADKFAGARLPAQSSGGPPPEEAPKDGAPVGESPAAEDTNAAPEVPSAPDLPADTPEPSNTPALEQPVAADPAIAPPAQDLPEPPSPVDGAMISDPGIPEPSAAPHLSPPDPPATTQGPVIAPLPDLADAPPQDAPEDTIEAEDPQAPAPVQGRPLLIAPLPSTTLPLSERLTHLVPGQIPVDTLKPLHAQLTALRARMNDR